MGFIGTLDKIIFEIQHGILEIIQFILSDKHLDGAGWSLRHFLDKFKQRHFHSPSNEVIFKLHAGVKKSHFGNFSDRAVLDFIFFIFFFAFLLWAKLEKAYSFRDQFSKIPVCNVLSVNDTCLK